MKGFLWCPHCLLPHALDALACPKTGKALQTTQRSADRWLARGSLIADRYVVRGWAGTESIAQLYVARQVATSRRVIVKLVRAAGLSPEDCQAETAEMHREAQAASIVEHPNVAPVLDFGQLGKGEAFLVRERVAGATLASALRSAGALA